MGTDFIPNGDPEFNDWIRNFCDYFNLNFAALGFTAADNTALQNLFNRWQTDYPAHITGTQTASSLAQAKNATRIAIEALVRQLSGTMQSNPNVDDSNKAALDITIPKTTKTASPVPSTRPIANVDNRNRLEHTINFFDEATPNSKAKPDGVRACEIWFKVSAAGEAPPTDASQLTYMASDTRTPYTYHFEGGDAGKTVHYWLRWVNTRGETGPWSETISVTISG